MPRLALARVHNKSMHYSSYCNLKLRVQQKLQPGQVVLIKVELVNSQPVESIPQLTLS